MLCCFHIFKKGSSSYNITPLIINLIKHKATQHIITAGTPHITGPVGGRKLKYIEMNNKDICVNIKYDEIIDFSQNLFNNTNRIITVIDAWWPPLIYNVSNQVCGPIIKLIEILCKEYGYRYLYMNREVFLKYFLNSFTLLSL